MFNKAYIVVFLVMSFCLKSQLKKLYSTQGYYKDNNKDSIKRGLWRNFLYYRKTKKRSCI